MNAIDIIKFMGELGIRFRESEIDQVLFYFSKMIEDKRIVVTEDESGLHTVICFSIGDSIEFFWKKKQWAYAPHDPQGLLFYIEKLISKGWNRSMREYIQAHIQSLYPHLREAHGHRWARWGDRHVQFTDEQRRLGSCMK